MVLRDNEAIESSEKLRDDKQKRQALLDQYDLPWSEEHSITQAGPVGYDGDLTSMTFNHVVKSNAFNGRDSNIRSLNSFG